LAEHASRVVLRIDVARSELSHLGPEPSEVRLAVCPLAGPELVADALREVRSVDPAVHVTVSTLDAASAVDALRARAAL
jgi:DNA-binding transcriptional LysR family regulator